ncbi:helix-turn-helix domain-containing protein [Streptacidiphilus sp. MAP5-3]|uniref:helix-turn-helix domain-containing protein n=1 Tax=unclassified Streptacidiphilus TaxID=2643834 RepID=UPI003517FFD3
MSSTPTSNAVMPDGLAQNAAAVYAALRTQPGQTPVELAQTTGLGRSTVSKILVALESAQLAHRERGTFAHNGRQPDRWHPNDTASDTAGAGNESNHNVPSASNRVEDPGHASTVTHDDAAEGGSEIETPESDDAGNGSAEATHEPVAPQPASRLGQGGLRALVLDYLQCHSEDPTSPTKIARALGRSSGAVANALVTLVNLGQAEMVTSKPRTYRLKQ